MPSPTGATLKLNRFKEMSVKTAQAIDKGVRELALAIQDQSQANIRANGSIDTGSMINSAYVETSRTRGSARTTALAKAIAASQGVARKTSRKSKKGRINRARAAMPTPAPTDLGHAKIAYAVEHAVYVECGVTGSATGDHPAKPFLLPAVEWVTPHAPGMLAQIAREEIGR